MTDFPNRHTVRPAAVADAKAIRMLLPEIREMSACFVAVDDGAAHVIGAAATTRAVRAEPPEGPGVALHVIPPFRRRGVGRKLLGCLETVAVAERARALYSVSRVESGGDAEQAWCKLGFVRHDTVETQRLPLDEFEPRLAPLLDRMRSRIPPNAQIVPLYRSSLPAVLLLHRDNLGGDRAEVYRKLRGHGVAAYHPRYSRVLLVEGRAVGCILAHRKDAETAIVDADIVDPALRGGWANVWLKLEATRGALRLGIKSFEYTTFDHYADTRSFTKKLGGVTIETKVLMMKLLVAEHA
jgi:GNAT superfamily N-acetyltransferase